MQDFSSFNLDKNILKGINEAGFKEPSPIQKEVIPLILKGFDIVGQAQTGTGKTAAFSLPILSKIDTDTHKSEVLVLTPTRELATQVGDEMYMLGRQKGIHTVTVYGQSAYKRQIELINRGTNVVVATPGRMLDLLKNDKLKNFTPSIVVVDEADEMLDMGFLEEIKAIFSYLPSKRQSMLFSATMPEPIKKLAKIILNEPKFVSVMTTQVKTNENIEQHYYVINEFEREIALIRLLDSLEPEKAVMFCRMKKEVDALTTKLIARGYSVKGLHGDMEQAQRNESIKAFKEGDIDFLVATDVAARGLHVDGITHVFNIHIPFNSENYVHRIGRTGRAGSKGVAITLCTPLEYHSMQKISKKVGTNIIQKNIPTLQEVRVHKLDKIAHEIKEADLMEEATAILDMLENDMSIAKIALKAISQLIQTQKSSGPENIGLSQKALQKLMKNLPKEDNNKRRNGRRRSRSSQRGGQRSSQRSTSKNSQKRSNSKRRR